MRQAIERSLQTFLGDSQETLPMTRSEESSQRRPRPGSRDCPTYGINSCVSPSLVGRSAVAAPGRRREDAQSCPRSAPTLPTRSGTRRTVSQVPSSERLRQHTRASQARIVAGRSRRRARRLPDLAPCLLHSRRVEGDGKACEARASMPTLRPGNRHR
eukprot:g22415.t1